MLIQIVFSFNSKFSEVQYMHNAVTSFYYITFEMICLQKCTQQCNIVLSKILHRAHDLLLYTNWLM